MFKDKKNKLLISLSEIKKELFERSVWPTRQEVVNQTVIVVFVLILASAFLGFSDYVVTYFTRVLLDGSFVSYVLGSSVGLILSSIIIILVVSYFIVRNFRKNKFDR